MAATTKKSPPKKKIVKDRNDNRINVTFPPHQKSIYTSLAELSHNTGIELAALSRLAIKRLMIDVKAGRCNLLTEELA